MIRRCRLLMRVIIVIVAAVATGSGLAAQVDVKALAAAAQKEKEVTWYIASLDARSAQTAARTFTALYGIKVNVVNAPSPVLFQRLTQNLSQNAQNVDVFSSIDVSNFVKLKNEGALAVYRPRNAAAVLPPFRDFDKDGMFQATVSSVIVIAYNKDKMSPDQAPHNWTDLLAPNWAGKVALGPPSFSVYYGHWAVQMNKLYGRPFFQKLAKMKPHVVRSMNDAVAAVSSGERAVTVAAAAPILTRADGGTPLAVQYPRDGAILVATPSAVLKDAPHPNAARLLMEFLLGPEFGRILVKAHYEPNRADVAPRSASPSGDRNILRPTVDEMTTGAAKVAAMWRDIFGH